MSENGPVFELRNWVWMHSHIFLDFLCDHSQITLALFQQSNVCTGVWTELVPLGIAEPNLVLPAK